MVLEEDVHLDLDGDRELIDAHIVAIAGGQAEEVDDLGDLDDLELTGCVVEGVRLTARSVRRARLTDVVLRDCELSGVDLSEARLIRVRIERCRAEGLEAGMVRADDVVAVGSLLTRANFRMSGWERASFDDCDLRQAELQDANLAGVAFDGCDLTRADLTRAQCSAVGFRNSRLEDLVGATALAGTSIDSAQLVPVALSIFAALKITLDAEAGSEQS